MKYIPAKDKINKLILLQYSGIKVSNALSALSTSNNLRSCRTVVCWERRNRITSVSSINSRISRPKSCRTCVTQNINLRWRNIFTVHSGFGSTLIGAIRNIKSGWIKVGLAFSTLPSLYGLRNCCTIGKRRHSITSIPPINIWLGWIISSRTSRTGTADNGC